MQELSLSIKQLIRHVIPPVLLKTIFLFFNKIRIATVDRLLFPEHKIENRMFRIYRKGFPFLESRIDVEDLPDDAVKGYMKDWRSWTQEEFLLILDQPCWIEPDHGWAIISPNNLVYYSLGVSRTWFQKKPSLLGLIRKKKITSISKAISLRDTGEENYFHFYNDVLSKIFFLQLNGVNIEGTPFIISKKLWDKSYFKFYFDNSPLLKSLIWIVQEDNHYIHCNCVVFCKPLTHRKDIWAKMLSPFKNKLRGGSRKVFLTRGKARLRFIENVEEIEKITRDFGFETVDTDLLSPAEQIALFSETNFLIGIHGAGMTNMAFRNGTCCVLEIFPPPDSSYLPYHYIMLAKMSGFHYRGIIGDSGRLRFAGGFHLNPQKLQKLLIDIGVNHTVT